jgi:ribonucleoside-diphosphate reductase alpha chain
VRRGHCAAYLDIEHGDIMEFLEAREEGHPIQHMSLGVCIGDDWLQAMIDGDSEKRKVWARILKKRAETGYPYLFFTDTVNRTAPAWYRDQGFVIYASNMCTEIFLPSSAEWSFVCCLSSLNDLHFDAWRDTDLVEVMTMFLEAVMEEYIRKTRDMPHMAKAHAFARDHRALGLGRLGWHSLLQSVMLPFASVAARKLNVLIQRTHDERSLAASKKMAEWFGEAPVCRGYGVRNATRMAIAPTTSSSFILGQVSQGIEPYDSNYFTKDLQKGKFGFRNPFLAKLLEDIGHNSREVWDSILVRGGSVQHLDVLSGQEKDVFKTWGEIDQMAIIQQAGDRQKFLDQGQSVNVKVHPNTPVKEVNALTLEAWKLGLKSLYYQRSTNPAQEYVRGLLGCAACEA